MEMTVTFPKGSQVLANFHGFTVLTDQPSPEGEGAAPTPFQLFLASIGTCVGYFVLSFCQSRKIPSDKVRVTMHAEKDTQSRLVEDIMISLHVPTDFPEKYREGIIRAASSCLVKRHMEHPPKFSINIARSE